MTTAVESVNTVYCDLGEDAWAVAGIDSLPEERRYVAIYWLTLVQHKMATVESVGRVHYDLGEDAAISCWCR